jgi:hypothetical protein
LAATEGTTFGRYLPLREGVALHRELARAEPTPAGVLEFANRYGPLGERAQLSFVDTEERRDFFDDWVRTIVWLREAIRLWDLIQSADEKALKRVIRWEGPLVHYYPPPEVYETLGVRPWTEIPIQDRKYFKGFDLLGSAPGGPELQKVARRGEVARPAMVFVHYLINAVYSNHVRPVLVWDPQRRRSVRLDVPQSLLSAIYVKFAQEVQKGRPARPCQVCGRFFDPAPSPDRRRGMRSDRATCSDACRSQAYRNRKQVARDLRARGRSPAVIAKELRTTVEVVKNWLAEQK